jgi:hypothetical protein
LRKQLRALRPEDANDIVEEIHAHILDKSSGMTAEGMVSTTLAALGTPGELAARYRTDDILKRAQSTRSPVVSLFSLARWATLSLVGLVAFVVSLAGYAVGALLVVIGLFKLIYPHNGGIWFDPKPGGQGIDGSAGFSFVGGNTWTHPVTKSLAYGSRRVAFSSVPCCSSLLFALVPGASADSGAPALCAKRDAGSC